MANGVAVPGFSASLGYFDTYRRAHVPANLVQVWHSSSLLLEPVACCEIWHTWLALHAAHCSHVHASLTCLARLAKNQASSASMYCGLHWLWGDACNTGVAA